MRIADVRTHVLEAKLSEPFAWSFNSTTVRTACLVEIACEDGTVGWGECFGPAALNAAIVAAFRPQLIGADPLAGDRIWLHLYNHFRDQGQRGLTITALSGVDVALWDIRGKHFGAPIHVLMGGPVRRQVAAYATGTYRRGDADPLGYIVEEVKGYAREGFHAVKLKIGFGVPQDAALIRACRDAVGPKVGLMLDANHGYDVAEAIELGRRVAACDIGWFEEPVVPEDLAGYAEVRRGQPIPGGGRGDLVHALELPRRVRRARRRHHPARHLRRRRAHRSPRRSPTWARPSACAACRTCGAPASASPPRCSSSRCCPTIPRATRPSSRSSSSTAPSIPSARPC